MMVNNACYIVSLVYHKIGDAEYEILAQEYIDLRSVFPIGDIEDDIGCYYEDWINAVTEEANMVYDVVYHSVFSVSTVYSRDYLGEWDCDMDWELISHKMDAHTPEEYIEYVVEPAMVAETNCTVVLSDLTA